MIRTIRFVLTVASLTATAAAVGHGAGGAAGAGGTAASHMSSTGMSNTNASVAADRDTGQLRAADRRSEDGTEHEKAKGPKSGMTKVAANHSNDAEKSGSAPPN